MSLFSVLMSHHRRGLVCCDVVWTGNKFILICASVELNREEDNTEVRETAGFTPNYFVV